MDDERLSDEATGLPPLEMVEENIAMLVLGWYASEGIVDSPVTDEPQAVRFLHARGIVLGSDGETPEWAQVFLAVPFEAAVEVAAALAKGTTTQLDGDGLLAAKESGVMIECIGCSNGVPYEETNGWEYTSDTGWLCLDCQGADGHSLG